MTNTTGDAAMTLDPSPMSPDELRAALDALGWTQAELAAKLGVAEGTVSGWINHTHACRGPAAALIRLLRTKDTCTSSSEAA